MCAIYHTIKIETIETIKAIKTIKTINERERKKIEHSIISNHVYLVPKRTRYSMRFKKLWWLWVLQNWNIWFTNSTSLAPPPFFFFSRLSLTWVKSLTFLISLFSLPQHCCTVFGYNIKKTRLRENKESLRLSILFTSSLPN